MHGRLPLLVVGLLLTVSCDSSPTAPTDPTLATSVAIGNATFSVASTYFWRDWMPIVQQPGPDGGSPLMAVIKVAIDNTGPADSATLLCTIRDSAGKNYAITTAVTDLATGKEWDGRLPANTRTSLSVSLRDGPYLAVNSTVFAVLTWNNHLPRTASMRTPDAQIKQTM